MKHTNKTALYQVYIATSGAYKIAKPGQTVDDFGAHVDYREMMIFAAVLIVDLKRERAQ